MSKFFIMPIDKKNINHIFFTTAKEKGNINYCSCFCGGFKYEYNTKNKSILYYDEDELICELKKNRNDICLQCKIVSKIGRII